MMKNKKTDFEARFWSGTRKYSAVGLLEAFFQFNDLGEVKETLSMMLQCSVQPKVRIRKEPAEIFHLYQSLRSLVLAGSLIGEKAKKDMFRASEKIPLMIPNSLPKGEYREPVRVFQNAFKVCSLKEFDEFLSAMVYFSLGNSRCDEEKSVIIPYLQLTKMLDAAWLIVERNTAGK